MKRTFAKSAALLALVLSLSSVAQVPNEGLANGIIAARQKNAALLKQFTWNCRTEMTTDGNLQDLRIELVNMNPDGTLQKTLLNDQEGVLPNGFFRHMIAENKRTQLEQYVAGLSGLVEQYTLPNPGAIVNFLSTAQIQPITTPAGKTVLQVTGNNVITPGDTFSMTIDGKSLLPLSLQITTFNNGDPVTIAGTFKAMKGGPNHLAYGVVNVASKNLPVTIHNYDYFAND